MASNAAGGTGPFSPAFMAACDNQLMTQFEIAEILAEKFGISREEMDAFSVESHRRAWENTQNGHFACEIVPVPVKDEEGRETGEMLEADEGIRPESTLESLGKLESAAKWDPSIAPDITAGNVSQMSDGASAMLIVSRETAEKLGLPVRARFLHLTVGADDAVLVLSAPNPVTRKLLDRSGLSISDFDAMECNEAFAAGRAHVGEGVPAGSREVQPAWWCDRDRSPARCEWRAHHEHAAEPPRGERRPARLPDDVRRRRPGERHRDRTPGLTLTARLAPQPAASTAGVQATRSARAIWVFTLVPVDA